MFKVMTVEQQGEELRHASLLLIVMRGQLLKLGTVPDTVLNETLESVTNALSTCLDIKEEQKEKRSIS